MEQVKFTCKMQDFQKDATAKVTIGESDMVADHVVNLDLKDLVE